MNMLAFFRKFTFTLIFAMVGVISWGQSRLSGSGTAKSPYIISSVDDWNEFANNPNYWGSDVYVELSTSWDNSANPIETMVGYDNGKTPFQGNFDGKDKTLTVALSGTYEIAPFYYTNNATIQNLIVTGTITASAGYAAGLIYSNDDLTTIENVTVSADIIVTNNAGSCGGFSSYSKNFSFNNCIYNGKIEAGSNSGGFCGAADTGGTMVFENCIFAPATESSISDGFTFGTEDDDNITITDCYYTNELGTTPQGDEAYVSAVPDGHIGHYETKILGLDIYKAIKVAAGIEETYLYEGTIDYYSTVTSCAVTFNGETATLGTDYTISTRWRN